MPYLKLTTNQALPAERTRGFLKAASQLVATELGKPEQYMMVAADPPAPMLLGGTDLPCAFLEVRGIGLPAAKAGPLSRSLCELVTARLGIAADRVYLNFADIPASHWGWNGETF
jgi:phenylpyruvate tautomerase